MGVEETGSTPTTPRETVRKFVLDHPTLLLSVVAALIFALRLAAVTGGDAHTATILFTFTSLWDAIPDLLMSLLPTLMGLCALVVAYVAGTRKGWRAAVGPLATSLILAALASYLSGRLLVGGELVPDWWSNIAGDWMLPLAVFGLSFYKAWLRRREKESAFYRLRLLSLVLLLLILIPASVVTIFGIAEDEFWLPRERLDFRNDAEPLIGYVLKEPGVGSDQTYVILKDDPRVVIERQGGLVDRAFCYPEGKGYEKVFKAAEEGGGNLSVACGPARRRSGSGCPTC